MAGDNAARLADVEVIAALQQRITDKMGTLQATKKVTKARACIHSITFLLEEE
jgi:hypothetical protein